MILDIVSFVELAAADHWMVEHVSPDPSTARTRGRETGGHIGLHRLLHHLPPGADRVREESLAHVGGDLGHRHLHLLRHNPRVRIERAAEISQRTVSPTS